MYATRFNPNLTNVCKTSVLYIKVELKSIKN